MKIRNTTEELRTTWNGQDVSPGDVFDASLLDEGEVKWLLRHGFEEVKKPKPKPQPKPAPPEVDTPVESSEDITKDFAPPKFRRVKKY